MIPNEIFGYPIKSETANSKKARKSYYCRFLNNGCDKQSRTIKYPMGVCSVSHTEFNPIICPHRYLEDNIVFKDVCREAFGSEDNVLLFKEIKLDNVGSFDFVLVKHKPISSIIEDFCIVEFQSDSTTGTGQLVNALKDFMRNNKIKNNYNFGLNTYNTIKLSYIQMLIKGQLMEKWNKNIFWILQKYLFENMTNRFKLNNLDYSSTDNTKYFLYDLEIFSNLERIKLVSKKSTKISNLLSAFTNQPTPSIDKFVMHLEGKINLNLGIILK